MLTARVAVRPQPVPWHCRHCPQVLGTITGERVTIRHQRREIEATLPCSQVCDKCGTLNVLDTGKP